jgi:hypothetical protein
MDNIEIYRLPKWIAICDEKRGDIASSVPAGRPVVAFPFASREIFRSLSMKSPVFAASALGAAFVFAGAAARFGDGQTRHL